MPYDPRDCGLFPEPTWWNGDPDDELSDYQTCPTCGGEGSWEMLAPQHDDPDFCVVVKCDECNGSGWVSH
jgi:DnaJ-class molecular chaperone